MKIHYRTGQEKTTDHLSKPSKPVHDALEARVAVPVHY